MVNGQTKGSVRRVKSEFASLAEIEEQRAVLDEAVTVIDAEHFERSQKDPRVHDLFEHGQALHAELDAKNANF